jgi:hypothetical protein
MEGNPYPSPIGEGLKYGKIRVNEMHYPYRYNSIRCKTGLVDRRVLHVL